MMAIVRAYRLLMVLAILSACAGCSMNVPHEKVYGTYVASYPYGTETITLNRDGTLVQRVAINQESPVTIHGSWKFEFDTDESRVTIHGAKLVDDGFGHLKNDWQDAPIGLWSLDIEEVWFRVEMASGSAYPYVKQ